MQKVCVKQGVIFHLIYKEKKQSEIESLKEQMINGMDTMDQKISAMEDRMDKKMD